MSTEEKIIFIMGNARQILDRKQQYFLYFLVNEREPETVFVSKDSKKCYFMLYKMSNELIDTIYNIVMYKYNKLNTPYQ